MPTIDHFELEAEISLSELRSEETLTERLRRYHRLRVRRRNDVVGVLVDVEEWRQLVRHVARLEAQADLHEDAAVRAIIADRSPNATFEPGSTDATAEIERDYQRRITGAAAQEIR